MSKKFVSKPIRNNDKLDRKKNEAEEDVVDFYENTEESLIQKPTSNRSFFVLVVMVSILFGFASAMAYDVLFASRDIGDGEQNIFIDKNEDVTVTMDERLYDLFDNINPAVVNFYQDPNGTGGPFYQDIYSFGTGFILTSDGWIVTVDSVLDKIGEKDYSILTADYKIYKVEKILRDPISPVVFVKIKARDLAVVKFGDVSELVSGQQLYGFLAGYPSARVASLHIADLQATTLEDVVASSEEISHFVSCREGYDQSLIGSPIVNISGEIVAIINDTKSATPLTYLNTAISDLSNGKEIERAKLGVHYINLAKYPKINLEAGEMRDKGALLSGYKNLTAVVANSAAKKAGLQVGDIITMVEDEIVNGRKTLTQIIQDYKSGQTVNLMVLRNGKENVFEVELE